MIRPIIPIDSITHCGWDKNRYWLQTNLDILFAKICDDANERFNTVYQAVAETEQPLIFNSPESGEFHRWSSINAIFYSDVSTGLVSSYGGPYPIHHWTSDSVKRVLAEFQASSCLEDPVVDLLKDTAHEGHGFLLKPFAADDMWFDGRYVNIQFGGAQNYRVSIGENDWEDDSGVPHKNLVERYGTKDKWRDSVLKEAVSLLQSAISAHCPDIVIKHKNITRSASITF